MDNLELIEIDNNDAFDQMNSLVDDTAFCAKGAWVNSKFLLTAGAILSLTIPAEDTFSAPYIEEQIINYTEAEISQLLVDYENKFDFKLNSYYSDDLVKHVTAGDNIKSQLIRDIISFQSLKQNWDGYGAYPTQVDCATNTIKLLDYLDVETCSKIDDIFPNPNGTVSIIWNNKIDETISLEIGSDTMSYYVDFKLGEPLFFNQRIIDANEANQISAFVRILA